MQNSACYTHYAPKNAPKKMHGKLSALPTHAAAVLQLAICGSLV